jgi:hypothetical protein
MRAILLQAVANGSRVGALALEQRVTPPKPELSQLGVSARGARSMSTDTTGGWTGGRIAPPAPRIDALAGLERHALVLHRDFGPNEGGGAKGATLEIRVCVQIDGGDWQRGVLVVQGNRSAVCAPRAAAACERAPRAEEQIPGVAAGGIDQDANNNMVAMPLQARDPEHAFLRYTSPLLVDRPSVPRSAYGYVVIDAFPPTRALTGSILCDILSSRPGTMLLQADGIACVVPTSDGEAVCSLLGLQQAEVTRHAQAPAPLY